MNKMIRVTMEEFYKVIGPLDVIVTAYPKETLFTLRNSREVVGRTEGYKKDIDEKFYELSEKWITKKESKKKQARYVVFPYGNKSKTDLLNDARFFATKREAIEFSKMREENEVREFYRSKPFYFRNKPIEFSELSKDEIEIVWEKFKDNPNTTDWIIMSIEEFEKQQNS